jgi:ABC-type multidrug transport system fused ATPase/permease subunit
MKEASHTSERAPIRIVSRHLRRHKGQLTASVLWRCLYVLVPMQVPLLTGAIVDGLTRSETVIYGLSLGRFDALGVLQFAVLGLGGLALTRGIVNYGRLVSQAKLSRHFVAELRKTLVEKLSFLSLDLHQYYGAGELLDRVLSDTGAMRRFLQRVFIQMITSVLRVAYPVAMMAFIDGRLTLIALSVLPVQWGGTRYLQNKLHRATRVRRETRSDLTTVMKETLDGIETVKSLAAEEASAARSGAAANRLEDDEMTTSRLSALISGIVWLTTGAGVALTWWQGGLRVMSGEMTIGALVAFTGFVTFAYRPFRRFTTIVNTYRRGIVSLERIQDIMDATSSVPEHPQAQPLTVLRGAVRFDDVTFAYNDEPVLNGVSFEAVPQQMTAIVGRSGSGKSSVLRLIARLYDPLRGRVLIDGQALDHVVMDSLRAQVAVVPQHPALFSMTVMENLRLGRPNASHDEVVAACEAAHALDFIEALSDGFKTKIGRRGISLSGGEAQRLAVARIILRRPAILLLDEPTSALDAESESAIVNTLLHLREQMTVVVVGHRLGTIRHADHVLLMDEGHLVAQGTHKTLAAKSPLYHELFHGDVDYA